jgi:hypothetical protein
MEVELLQVAGDVVSTSTIHIPFVSTPYAAETELADFLGG